MKKIRLLMLFLILFTAFLYPIKQTKSAKEIFNKNNVVVIDNKIVNVEKEDLFSAIGKFIFFVLDLFVDVLNGILGDGEVGDDGDTGTKGGGVDDLDDNGGGIIVNPPVEIDEGIYFSDFQPSSQIVKTGSQVNLNIYFGKDLEGYYFRQYNKSIGLDGGFYGKCNYIARNKKYPTYLTYNNYSERFIKVLVYATKDICETAYKVDNNIKYSASSRTVKWSDTASSNNYIEPTVDTKIYFTNYSSTTYTLNKGEQIDFKISFGKDLDGYYFRLYNVSEGLSQGYWGKSCLLISKDKYYSSYLTDNGYNKRYANIKVYDSEYACNNYYNDEDEVRFSGSSATITWVNKQSESSGNSSTGSNDVTTNCPSSTIEKNGYCMVKDNSNGGYLSIGSQPYSDKSSCLCYSESYIYNMYYNIELPYKYSCPSTNQKFIKKSYTSIQETFVAIKNNIIAGKGVSPRINNNSDSQHFIAVIGIKESSLTKTNGELTYSDFYVIDPTNTKESTVPKEYNWADLAKGSAGTNRTLRNDNGYAIYAIY